ncbi:MAG: ABC transporter permease [Nitratireductor sp.]|nr:ABC transporter permease [Nitratireductor sp.]
MGLVLPGLLFFLVMFVWPIAQMLSHAVYSPEVQIALPRTVAAMADWDVTTPPSDAIADALILDLKNADRGDLASAARRLNYEQSGFRAALLKTAREVRRSDGAKGYQALLDADKDWADLARWRVLRSAGSAYTSYYLLTALDLEKRPDGSIGRVPGDRALFVTVILRTLWLSLVVTVICLFLAFPVSYTIASAKPGRQALLMLLILLPFWISLLVRSSAWVILLQDNGLVNTALLKLGIITEPVQLIFNRTGVYIGLVHVLLPFMVLPITNAMRAVPKDYVRAAFSMGASAPRALFQVYLPQIWPGVAAGSLLTFVICVGYYVTPLLIGGNQDQMLSYFIAFYTNQSVNWGLASALSAVLCAIMLLLMGLYALVPRRGGTTAGR